MKKIITNPVSSVSVQQSHAFPPVNTLTNMLGYFCQNGNIHILESKCKNMLLKRSATKKSSVSLGPCLNTLIKNTLPYIKVKPKKSRGRRKTKKALLLSPIDRVTSKRKAYRNFSSFFKSNKNVNKPFISRLENEFESFSLSSNKRQPGVTKHSLTEKRDLVNKSAFKYRPYS